MPKFRRTPLHLKRDEATLMIVMHYGVPVRRMATALNVSRQTVYRRMDAMRRYLRLPL